MPNEKSRIEVALEEATETLIKAIAETAAGSFSRISVAGAAGAGAGQSTVGSQAGTGGTGANVGQSTQGAQGTAGGAAAQTGLSTQGAASEISNKADVSGPEVIEGLNLHTLKDAAVLNKALISAQGQIMSSNAKLYDVGVTALGLATLGASHHNTLQMQMASDHRDQNHDKQINVDEQALAVVQATIVQAAASAATAAVLAALGKTGSGL